MSATVTPFFLYSCYPLTTQKGKLLVAFYWGCWAMVYLSVGFSCLPFSSISICSYSPWKCFLLFPQMLHFFINIRTWDFFSLLAPFSALVNYDALASDLLHFPWDKLLKILFSSFFCLLLQGDGRHQESPEAWGVCEARWEVSESSPYLLASGSVSLPH